MWLTVKSRYTPELAHFFSKQLPSHARHWDKERKVWMVSSTCYPLIANSGFEHECNITWPQGPHLEINPELISKHIDHLFDFQAQGAMQMVVNGGGILRYDTGLGKTRTALGAHAMAPNQGAVWVLCPPIVIDTWKQTAELFGLTSIVVQSLYDTKLQPPKSPVTTIIIDEAHLLKSNKKDAKFAPRVIAAVNACRDVNPGLRVICCTATPITNHPDDLWNVLNLCQPGEWGKSIYAFKARYLTYDREQIINPYTHQEIPKYTYTGTQNEYELALRLQTCVHDVKVGEIRQDLGTLSIRIESAPNTIQAAIHRAQQLPSAAIFAYRRESAEEIAKALGTKAITGATPANKRSKAHRAKYFVATFNSMGVGIDLTEYSDVLFAEINYNPADIIQTIGRFRRLSAQGKTTNVTILYSPNSESDNQLAFIRSKLRDIGRLEVNTATGAMLLLSGQTYAQERLQKVFDTVQEDFMLE